MIESKSTSFSAMFGVSALRAGKGGSGERLSVVDRLRLRCVTAAVDFEGSAVQWTC